MSDLAPSYAEMKMLEDECADLRANNKRYRAEIERLQAALKPFADAVYNDNGDMTITPASLEAYRKAYFVMRAVQQKTRTEDGL